MSWPDQLFPRYLVAKAAGWTYHRIRVNFRFEPGPGPGYTGRIVHDIMEVWV